jgi:hypothetical protein
MPFHGTYYEFTQTGIANAPELPGIFGLYVDETPAGVTHARGPYKLIFIGRSDNIGDKSLRSVLSANQRGERSDCTVKATHFRFRECEEPGIALREALGHTLEEKQRLPQCNPESDRDLIWQ